MPFDFAAWKRQRRADPTYRRHELARDAKTSRARRKKNLAKAHAADKVAYDKNSHLWVKRRLKKLYGITFGEWKVMLAAQEFRCANNACSAAVSHGDFSTAPWATDHDHKTGTVRGVLCHKCNRALGFADDDPSRLQGLAEYLEDRKDMSHASN